MNSSQNITNPAMSTANNIYHKKATKGFTLIELLVVIAIIALLVSILLPSLNKAKDLARDVVCLSTLRALGMGAMNYSFDNDDDTIPLVDDWPMADQTVWYARLARGDYVTAEAFKCPSEKVEYDVSLINDPDGAACDGNNASGVRNATCISYGLNYLVSANAGQTPKKYAQVATASNASNLIYFADSTPQGASNVPTAGYYLYWSSGIFPLNELMGAPLAARHGDNGYVNSYFIDGHTDKISVDELTEGDICRFFVEGFE